MATASTRVLQLLSLLQTRPSWSGADLGERLSVDVRTIRRDAERLRELGYTIESSAGPGGGYRLTAGADTPPLLLDSDEAVAVAIALSALTSSPGELSDIALRVLVKLDQLLPRRLRKKWSALSNVTLSLATRPAVDVKMLTQLAAGCRDEHRVQFKYSDRLGQASMRDVEPMRLVHTGHVWYLVAWDMHRQDWRTFRLDRIDTKAGLRTGPRFSPRRAPEDFATYVSRSITAAPHRYRARFALPLSLTQARAQLPHWLGVLEPLDGKRCSLTVGADTEEEIVALVMHAGVDFELLEPRTFEVPLRRMAHRLAKGTRPIHN